ncbi:MAG: glycosyltransferase WbuB [Deltaproteobacteria bacterium]|nr:MAG: glycosyltransferase WbuB [Deltaproteobacteria bacterium]
MNPLKTKFFTQLYSPDLTTTAIIMNDLAEDLVFYGLDISVVCAQPTYLLKRKCPVSEVINGVKLNRVRTFLFDKNKILGRIFNSASCFIIMLFKVIFAGKNDLSVFNTNPALLPFLGLVGLGFKGQKYVVLIHDLWPELPAHTGLIKESGLIFKAIDFINVLSLKNASGIIVLSGAMKKMVLKKVPEMKDRIFVIHNWADNTRIYPVAKEKNPLLDDFGLRGKKVVMYSGNLGRYQPLEVMIHAAMHLQDRNDIIFLFVGDGAKKKKLQEMVKKRGLENVKFLPFQPMERLAESLSMADVSLMGILPENEGVIMPSKLYGLLSVGKPIVCVSDHKSEVVSILKMAGAGIHASIHDPENLASIIKSIIDEPLQAQKMGENGRNYFLKHFERKIITMQWKEVLESIIRTEEDLKRNSPGLEIQIPMAEVSPN